MARVALQDIEIFAPNVNVDNSFNAYTYVDVHGVTQSKFPITDNCERSAQLMGDDYVRLRFDLTAYVPMSAFSFIRYCGQTFFLMDDYRPQSKGSRLDTETGEVTSDAYEYDVKFYSVANMLRKPICYRHVKVSKEGGGYYEWDEPEINVSATLETMYVIIVGSIKQYALRLNSGFLFKKMLDTLVANGEHSYLPYTPGENVKLTQGTELSTFSFNGEKIADVCTSVANQYSDEKKDTEWYIVESGADDEPIHDLILHFCKCEDDEGGAVSILSDFSRKNNGLNKYIHPTITGGLSKMEYSRDTSNIPQLIVPFGAERNMTYQAVKGIDEVSQMQSTFGKRLRLKTDHTCVIDGVTYPTAEMRAKGITGAYAVEDKNGNTIPLGVDAHGGIANDLVNTGVEQVEYFDDVYPQCHFRVTKVEERMKRQDGSNVPVYTCEGQVVNSEGHIIQPEGNFYPLQIEEGATLSVRFESGFLNGREFEIANKTSKKNKETGAMNANYTLKFVIVADGSIEDGTLIPSGNFIPRARDIESGGSYEGDMFALFNMKMPEEYIAYAQEELAQKAYEKLIEYQDTVPDVKCTTNADDFGGKEVFFGKRYKINSEKIGFTYRDVVIDGETKTVRVPIDFLSRITAYSYKLTKPDDVQFTLSSALVRGTLAEIANAVTQVTNVAGGLGQRSLNLSRRGWRDASEIADMLDSIRTENMLVGNEKYQFGYTMAIRCEDANDKGNEEAGAGDFDHLRYDYGTIQHTQQPYVTYANSGLWEVGADTLDEDVDGEELVTDEPYYVYADCQVHAAGATAEILLVGQNNPNADDYKSGEDYMLLGILSSEYEGKRVFSRTNGFTAIEGGTITTEQIQDANRQLIIDFQSNPPRIVAVNGAEIFGNIRFKSILTEDGKDAGEEIFKEIGGENLYTGYNPITIDNIFETGIELVSGKKYVVSASHKSVSGFTVFIALKENIGGRVLEIGRLGKQGVDEDDVEVVIVGHGGTLKLQPQGERMPSATLTDLMVQLGEKKTAYQTHVKYLASAFDNAARAGSTDIDGGLLMTSLLKLRNERGVVTSGMSGLRDVGTVTIEGEDYESEGVGFWAGGDYSDAIAAACGLLPDLPVLLTKTGILSRIGCFKVVDKDTIKVVTDNNEIVITNDSIDAKAPTSPSIDGGATIYINNRYSQEASISYSRAAISSSVPKGNYTVTNKATSINVGISIATDPKSQYQWYLGRASLSLKIEMYVSVGGVVVQTKQVGTYIGDIYSTGTSSENYRTDTIPLSNQSVSFQCTRSSSNVEVGYRITGDINLYDVETGANSEGGVQIDKTMTAKLIQTDKYVVIAKDGIAIINSSEAMFKIKNGAGLLELYANGLPTSPTGLSSGQIWQNSYNQLCIMP